MPKSWNPWQTFDVTEKERELINKRREMRDYWRQEFQRKSTSPYRPSTTIVFDPAVQRAISARATFQNYYRPNRKALAITAFMLALPIAYTYCYMKFYREPWLKALSNGEIAYKNRDFKLLE